MKRFKFLLTSVLSSNGGEEDFSFNNPSPLWGEGWVRGYCNCAKLFSTKRAGGIFRSTFIFGFVK